MAGLAETIAFAEFLRELKDRSGLSYGALAKRLHMSTSTLHRYCNGDAVPADYAPVERLARLCKATSGELVEVHRRWILADAARRQKPSAEAAAVAEARPQPEPRTQPATQPQPAPQSRPAPEPAAARTAPITPEPPDELDDLRPVPDSGSGAGTPAPRPPRRRRIVLIAAAAVAAVLASTALTVNLVRSAQADDEPGRRGSSDGASASSSGSASSDSNRLQAGPRRTASGKSSASASASADHSASASPGSSSGATGGADSPARKRTGQDTGQGTGENPNKPLLAAKIRPYAYEDQCTQHYLVDRRAKNVTPPPNEADAPGWVAAMNAVSADDQYVELSLQGLGKETVLLRALHVRVVKSGPSLPWNHFATGIGCGGGVSTKFFKVDLDEARPTAAAGAQQRRFPVKVSESDPEVFYVSAEARSHAVSWYLELEWSSGTREGTLRIDNKGQPFRTSGAIGRPYFEYALGATGWVEKAPLGPSDYRYR